MNKVRLGAVGYLNARPLVYGLETDDRFTIRYDLPSQCAKLLHEDAIDVGLIPSIEYLRGPRTYGIVPRLAIASRGPVASVALYTRKESSDIRTIAMDTSSRTSVALAAVIAQKAFGVAIEPVPMAPDIDAMLVRADAALIIGDNALLLDHQSAGVRKIDLGEMWTNATGLPFVYAFWAGRPDRILAGDVGLLQAARDRGIAHYRDIAHAYFTDRVEYQSLGEQYLRDNIHYDLGAQEMEGLQAFYAYAAEAGLVSYDGELRFYAQD
jgi:chorismate dehydratase